MELADTHAGEEARGGIIRRQCEQENFNVDKKNLIAIIVVANFATQKLNLQNQINVPNHFLYSLRSDVNSR